MSAELLNEFDEDPFVGHDELQEGAELSDDIIQQGLGEPLSVLQAAPDTPNSVGSDFTTDSAAGDMFNTSAPSSSDGDMFMTGAASTPAPSGADALFGSGGGGSSDGSEATAGSLTGLSDTGTGLVAPTSSGSVPGLGSLGSGFGSMAPESAKLREWRLAHEQQLADKASASRQRQAEADAVAEKELAEFYEKRAAAIAARSTTNKEAEDASLQSLAAQATDDNVWTRVRAYVDLQGLDRDADAKDVSRMKEVMIQMFHAE